MLVVRICIVVCCRVWFGVLRRWRVVVVCMCERWCVCVCVFVVFGGVLVRLWCVLVVVRLLTHKGVHTTVPDRLTVDALDAAVHHDGGARVAGWAAYVWSRV